MNKNGFWHKLDIRYKVRLLATCCQILQVHSRPVRHKQWWFDTLAQGLTVWQQCSELAHKHCGFPQGQEGKGSSQMLLQAEWLNHCAEICLHTGHLSRNTAMIVME